MGKKGLLTGAAIAVVAGIVALLPHSVKLRRERSPRDLVIATGPPGGTYELLGNQLARILEEHPGAAIGSVTPIATNGSGDNIKKLAANEANVGVVFGPELAAQEKKDKDEIRVLHMLYPSLLYVVVRKDIDSLSALEGKHLFLGPEDSGTRWLSKKVLQRVIGEEYAPGWAHNVDATGFTSAAKLLIAGQIDAMFMVSSSRAPAVASVIEDTTCCKLLDLKKHDDALVASIDGLKKREIAPQLYANQLKAVRTVEARTFLVGHDNLDNDVVIHLQDAFFDKVGDFKEIRAQDIRLRSAFPDSTDLGEGVKFHPGADTFAKAEKRKLVIATGAINGTYYKLGRRMAGALAERGIETRVIHTDGSVENADILGGETWFENRPAIVIMQYDAALKAYWRSSGKEDERAGKDEGDAANEGREHDDGQVQIVIPRVKGMRRIATLHEEQVHIVMRRELLPSGFQEQPTVDELRGALVCLGPEASGSHLLANELLTHLDVKPRERIHLSIPDMVERIHAETIEAAFFTGHVPSDALKTLLQSDNLRLLSIEPPKIAGLVRGPELTVSKIEAGIYGSQRQGEPPIDTIATKAVLVTTKKLNDGYVEEITEALFEASGFLGLEDGPEGMAESLPSLPLHNGAERYYKRAGYLPSKSSKAFDWVGWTRNVLAILVILVAAYRGGLELLRNRTRNSIYKRILAVSTAPEYPHSVEDLTLIRREIHMRVRTKWWDTEHLDPSRSRELDSLANEQIGESKVNLKRTLLAQIHALGDSTHDVAEGLSSLEDRIWLHLITGELDVSQHKPLLDLMRTGFASWSAEDAT